jgi:hypothetical protein
MIHKVEKPLRNVSNGLFKIRCSCGWFTIKDSLEEVEKRAAVHDREWIAVESTDERSVSGHRSDVN